MNSLRPRLFFNALNLWRPYGSSLTLIVSLPSEKDLSAPAQIKYAIVSAACRCGVSAAIGADGVPTRSLQLGRAYGASSLLYLGEDFPRVLPRRAINSVEKMGLRPYRNMGAAYQV